MAPRLKRKFVTTEHAPALATGSAGIRSSRRTLRGRRGGLANMPDMPLDILLEIFVYLHPRDLLNLARTSKALRKYLMSRDFAFIWKAARRLIENFPECPSYLSEPAYVNLAFFNHCHGCLKANIKTVLWELRVRYCNDCTKSYLYYQSLDLYYYLHNPQQPDHSSLSTMVPRTASTSIYHLPEITEVVTRLNAVAHTPDERKYIEDRMALVEEVGDHAKKCITWFKNALNSRAEELQKTRDDRLAVVFEKLRDAGWEEEVEHAKRENYRDLRADQKLFAQLRVPKPLSDHAWAKMRDGLTVLMQQLRSKRLIEERWDMFRDRCAALTRFISAYFEETPRPAEELPLPNPVDFAFMQEFRDIVDSPATVKITVASFDALRPSLPTLIARWHADIKAELASLVSSHIDIPEGVDALKLAVATFGCKQCGRNNLHYPGILSHSCFRPMALYSPREVSYDKLILQMRGMCRWSCEKAYCAFAAVHRILKACDLPPERTTIEEMDRLNPRLMCRPTNLLRAKVFVDTWRQAIAEMRHWQGDSLSLERVDDEEPKKDQEIEVC
ncbi:hypothetical protein B0H21DRAFT_815478 [Amylocystis lapponica]|nr:hypothetical protein B0H21DRAFT_815478 [Amylocystis lapponica]